MRKLTSIISSILFLLIISVPLLFAVAKSDLNEKTIKIKSVEISKDVSNNLRAENMKSNEQVAARQELHHAIDSIPNLNMQLQTTTNWVLILPTIVTIVIVICGAVVTIKQLKVQATETRDSFNKTLETQKKIAEDSLKVQVLANNRQAWINTLRDEIASFISLIYTAYFTVTIFKDKLGDESDIDLGTKITMKVAKIKLLINPEEDDHKQLVSLIDKIVPEVLRNKEGALKYVNEIVTLSQSILKREWIKVKKLE
jgi:hypothetical protein